MKFGFRGLFGGCGDKNKERVRAPFAGAKIQNVGGECKCPMKRIDMSEDVSCITGGRWVCGRSARDSIW